LAENLLVKWPSEIASLTLIPSDGGVYEVEMDDRLIYSKKRTGRHAQAGEVESLFAVEIKK